MPNPMPRHVEPEWLDVLPADDPRAMRSRGDLRRVNAVMRQSAIMARALRSQGGEQPRTLLDLGSGDGTFLLAVARRLTDWRDVTVRLLDRQGLVTDGTRRAFAALGWRAEPVAADLVEFLERDDAAADAITANLVLHHFDADSLPNLLRLVARRTNVFVACEPRRARHALFFSRMLWAIGGNDVTRHDAPASVRAGFHGRELSALWPDPAGWRLRESAAGLFSHRFVAVRA